MLFCTLLDILNLSVPEVRSIDILNLYVSEIHYIHRGSYRSAHVLSNLLNALGKRDKMRGLPSILSLFRNEFDKFNKTRARMLAFMYHMTLRIL